MTSAAPPPTDGGLSKMTMKKAAKMPKWLIVLSASCQFMSSAFQFPSTLHHSNRVSPSLRRTIIGQSLSDVLVSGTSKSKVGAAAVERYFDAWNRRDLDEAIAQFSEDAMLDDTAFPGVFSGKSEIKRHFLLCADAFPDSVQFVLDDIAADGSKIGAKWHIEYDEKPVPNGRGCSFYNINEETGLIEEGFDVIEPTNKSGKVNLAVLSAAGKFIEKTGINLARQEKTVESLASSENAAEKDSDWFSTLFGRNQATAQSTAAERYFEAWNNRDMEAAASLFSEECLYEDTVFPEPFSSRQALKKHLLQCADAFPSTFSFVVDDIADAREKIGVKWHVENAGEPLPFTRGCSFYNIDTKTGLIEKGFDEVEPSVIKAGGIKLALLSLVTKLAAEPVRIVPLAMWGAYMYVVFLSDGILPGANAFQLEQRTWEEVRDLSLNFFLVSPLLNLPFSPVVHPMLEGVFNLLLSWAALFAGFLSDEREEKPNSLPMLPMVAGMQFLTSAFLLPFLVTRSSEKSDTVCKEDLDTAGRVVGESKVLGPFLGSVGLGSIVWAFVARHADFGGINERFPSFVDLLSIDRVGSSFIVDLVVFALFQGWLVDDDMRRRGFSDPNEYKGLRNVAKFVPFFGLAAYLTLRPPMPSRDEI